MKKPANRERDKHRRFFFGLDGYQQARSREQKGGHNGDNAPIGKISMQAIRERNRRSVRQ